MTPALAFTINGNRGIFRDESVTVVCIICCCWLKENTAGLLVPSASRQRAKTVTGCTVVKNLISE